MASINMLKMEHSLLQIVDALYDAKEDYTKDDVIDDLEAMGIKMNLFH